LKIEKAESQTGIRCLVGFFLHFAGEPACDRGLDCRGDFFADSFFVEPAIEA
jgi:hypothetical protein